MPLTRTRTSRLSARPQPALAAAALIMAAIAGAGAGQAYAGGEGGGRPGTLGQVTGAVREHMDARGAGGGGGDPTPRPGDRDYFYGSYDGYVCPTCAPVMGGAVGGPHVSGPAEPMEVSLSLGLQSVVGSDAALSGAARVRLGGFALELEGAEYWERARTGAETIYMDIWSIRVAGRVVRLGSSELWVEGGLCGTGSNVFDRVTGTVIGAGLLHALRQGVSLRGGARYYVFEEDLVATEARADLGVSFLSVGYRVLELGAGPALHGPGVAVQATF
jgi:hypothetical protein